MHGSKVEKDGWGAPPPTHNMVPLASVVVSTRPIRPVKRRTGILHSRLRDLRISGAEDPTSGHPESSQSSPRHHLFMDLTRCVLSKGETSRKAKTGSDRTIEAIIEQLRKKGLSSVPLVLSGPQGGTAKQ